MLIGQITLSKKFACHFISTESPLLPAHPMTEEVPPSQPAKPRQKRRDDFNLLDVLGHGAFGQVIEVEDKETKIHYAMKILSKAHIIHEKKMNYVKVERDAMMRLKHPNIVKLFLTFQDPGNLYYVVELGHNGDLQSHLNQIYTLDLPIAKMILGQVLLAVAAMHKEKVLHRDLKPENILLDKENRVKITDFGTAKLFGKDDPFYVDRGSFVGSADYVPPEVLEETTVGPASDLWSFGCIVYDVLVGYPPYHSESNYATFGKIQSNNYELPDFLPEDAKDLIRKLLVLDPKQRLGYNEFQSQYEPIRNHPFFKGIDWEKLPLQPIPKLTPFLPAVEERDRKLAEVKPTDDLLEDDEKIDQESLGKFINPEGISKDVFLIYTTKQRLLIVNIKKSKVKAEIPLNKSLKIGKVGEFKLRFMGPDIFFFFEFKTAEDLNKWFDLITSITEKSDI